ncbi:TonB-dependent receptor [Thalassotalea agarivorans]|uniref:TonB-dependent receptor n=1 Tax=Thalassotalea agarivorans TaxID=349064 RepID=A0A1I0DPJ6_THASX|nr:TonB-dependent receptor [Thalassotalea agarivorans]SET34474.1 TonB-dependent receptor [Thalassotalea agarivorans]
MNLKINKISLSVLLALGSTMLMPSYAFAQEEDAAQAENQEPELEVIEIKGIRGSMIRSMDLKRDASGIVDAISAEEMGKFPDTNLAESLGRITGVSVSRQNGEGSQITVRGFGPEFNLVTLNGRQMPGTGFTRSFSFENLSSEGVSALEIQKSARAETPTGGLGATVNIVTTKPLSNPGTQGSFMAKGIYDESNVKYDDITPEIAGVVSSTMFDDMFGVSLSFSHQRRDFRKQQANIQGWQYGEVVYEENDAGDMVPVEKGIGRLPTLDESRFVDPRAVDGNGERVGAHYFPKDMNFGYEDVRRERNNGQLTLQFEPFEGLRFTADYTATQATTAVESYGWGIWNNFGSNIIGYELDANGTAVYADIAGDDGSFTASKGTTEVDNSSLGFNMDWQLTDNINVVLDYHDSSSKVDNGADSGSGSQGQVILGSDKLTSKIFDYRNGDIPHYTINWDNGTNELMASEIDSNFSQFIHSPGESEIEQVQLHFTWATDMEYLTVVKFGAARTDQSLTARNGWSGLRGGPGFNPSFTAIFPDDMFIQQSTSGFLDQFKSGGDNLAPHYFYTFDFDEAVSRQLAVLTEDLMGDNVYTTDPYFAQDISSRVDEVTDSFYVQTDFEFEIGEMYLGVNAGLRYETTDVSSPSEDNVPQQVNWVSAGEWITIYQADPVPSSNSSSYDILLPMIDFKLDVTDDIVARLSLGKTMTRSGLGNLLGGTSYTGSPKIGARTGSRGNTALKPFVSNNIDLSFEYYYEEGSYLSIGLFKKDVDDWIASSTLNTTLDGVHDIYLGERWNQAVNQIEQRGEVATDSAIFQQFLVNGYGNADGAIEADPATDPLLDWSISSPENVDKRSVQGAEFAMQHLIGDTGFGFAVNATFVNGDVEYDPYINAEQPVLPGLSDSANLQLFYDLDGLSVKATYSWRDKYLIGLGQAQGTTEDSPPQYAKQYGQWDISVNYDVTENITVFLEGVNINNETEVGYGRFENQFLYARQYGPRYALGGRFKF